MIDGRADRDIVILARPSRSENLRRREDDKLVGHLKVADNLFHLKRPHDGAARDRHGNLGAGAPHGARQDDGLSFGSKRGIQCLEFCRHHQITGTR